MAFILNIETATTVCSVSISENGNLMALKELDNGFTHAENLHLFIRDVLNDAGITTAQLDAIALSKGPGSYTGLRIGASTAKGLAYALRIPLVAVDTLQIMARQAKEKTSENASYCAMIDARRMEVYTATYDQQLHAQSAVEPLIVDEQSITKFRSDLKIYFFGDGMPKCRELLSSLPNAAFIESIAPSAKDMCQLAFEKYTAKQFEDVAYFEPLYLKDFLIKKKKTA